MAWDEFFKDKPEPKSEEDKKQQEEFYFWYNYTRKQSDTGKTPAEMYKEAHGKEPPKDLPISADESSRMLNFEWDEEYDEDPYEEKEMREVTKLADRIFNNDIWQNSKEEIRDLSRREAAQCMFRLGFYTHFKIIDKQMKSLNKKLRSMSEEEIKKMFDEPENEGEK